MNLSRSFILALFLALSGLGIWEMTLRKMGYMASIRDDKARWAVQRATVETLSAHDVVVVGSSRAHFTIQLDVWEQETGVRPVMLASDGTTPTPVILDIVENTTFNGILLIGVSPGLFFSKPERGFMWHRVEVRIKHYYDRTFAQRLNHVLSLPLERSFAFLNAEEEDWDDAVDLKGLLSRIRIGAGNREGPPPFYNFNFIDEDRNVTMFQKVVNDTSFAGSIKRFWMFANPDESPPVMEELIALYKPALDKFRNRGGRVIFARFPSSGDYLKHEKDIYPRDRFWDKFLTETGTVGYHFEDYPILNQYDCPEWSHLATPDARQYTLDFIDILKKDQQIQIP